MKFLGEQLRDYHVIIEEPAVRKDFGDGRLDISGSLAISLAKLQLQNHALSKFVLKVTQGTHAF